MAEQKSKTKDNAFHSGAKEKNKKEQIKKIPQSPEIDNRGRIIRIMQKDIEGGMKLYPGLTKIKGISWSLSNAVCKNLGFDKNRKIESLSESEIKKLEEFLKNPVLPEYLKNRQKDFKRLKKIKSYKGYRHSAGLPVRGQRTRAHFRKNRSRGAGIKKK